MLKVHASSLARIMACNGSVALAAQAPKPAEQDASNEGQAAHWLAEQMFIGAPDLKPGIAAPNGHICDSEMFEHIGKFHDLFNTPDLMRAVEAPTHWTPAIANPTFEVRGKADLVIWNPDQQTLAITDLKYGYRYVDARDNWQLLAYAIGVAMAARIQPDTFILAIYQPRGPGETLRYWEATPAQVLEAYHRICATMEIVTEGADNLQTGAHCRYCPAALGCPAAERATYAALDVAMNASAYSVRESSMAVELQMLERAGELLKQRRMWIEGAALAAIKDGRAIPGLSSRPVLGHTAWLPGAEARLRELQSDNQRFFDDVPVTPAEAKRRGLDAETIAAMTHRPMRGYKLTVTHDR